MFVKGLRDLQEKGRIAGLAEGRALGGGAEHEQRLTKAPVE